MMPLPSARGAGLKRHSRSNCALMVVRPPLPGVADGLGRVESRNKVFRPGTLVRSVLWQVTFPQRFAPVEIAAKRDQAHPTRAPVEADSPPEEIVVACARYRVKIGVLGAHSRIQGKISKRKSKISNLDCKE